MGKICVFLQLLLVSGLAGLSFAEAPFNIREHLCSKSPYPTSSPTPQTSPPETCVPIHVEMVARHGSRNPTSSDISRLSKLKSNVIKYNSSFNISAFPWLQTWESPFLLQDQGELVFNGEEEHYLLAKRMNDSFPNLFYQTYDPDVYIVSSTQVSRAGMSASAFLLGMFEGKGQLGANKLQPFFINSESVTSDIYLRFFDNCPKYIETVSDNSSSNPQLALWTSQQFPAILEAVAKKLGVFGVWNLTSTDLDSMFRACSHEVTLLNITDHWCSVFTPEELNIIEYGCDLDDYYSKGYGYEINYQMACPLLSNVIQSIDNLMKTSLETNTAFAHAETIVPFVALLGLFKDEEPLSGNPTSDFLANHKFLSSKISPYTSNIQFILYNCSDNNSTLIKVLFQEEEIIFPGCAEIYCPYDTFKNALASRIVCDFDSLCQVSSPTSAPTPVPSESPTPIQTISPTIAPATQNSETVVNINFAGLLSL